MSGNINGRTGPLLPFMFFPQDTKLLDIVAKDPEHPAQVEMDDYARSYRETDTGTCAIYSSSSDIVGPCTIDYWVEPHHNMDIGTFRQLTFATGEKATMESRSRIGGEEELEGWPNFQFLIDGVVAEEIQRDGWTTCGTPKGTKTTICLLCDEHDDQCY